MGKVVHIYNTKGQKACSKEYRLNKDNEVPYGFKEIEELKKGEKPICKRCAKCIGKPYFSSEYLFEMSLKLKTD